jgi:hypothetical protein
MAELLGVFTKTGGERTFDRPEHLGKNCVFACSRASSSLREGSGLKRRCGIVPEIRRRWTT